MLIAFEGKSPVVDPTAFIAPTAVLIGDVEVGAEASIWFGTVIRADNGPIRIGARSSVQDNAVLHVSERGATIVCEDVTVGHGACLEDCRIEAGALVGSGAIVLNGAVVGHGAVVGAGSVVLAGFTVPPETLAVGSPARVHGPLAEANRALTTHATHEYVGLSYRYRRELATT